MANTIQIPSPLRRYTDGRAELTITAATVGDVLQQLQEARPELYGSICDETGALRRHINLFVNSVILDKRTASTSLLAPGDVLTIMPAVSGG